MEPNRLFDPLVYLKYGIEDIHYPKTVYDYGEIEKNSMYWFLAVEQLLRTVSTGKLMIMELIFAEPSKIYHWSLLQNRRKFFA